MAGGGGWSWAERYKPCVAMVLVQWFYALVDMALKTAYGLGMRPIVFVAYRQGIAAATLLLASLATRGCTLRPMAVGARPFALLFMASLATATGQYFYFLGLQLASPSMARATTNLSPGITFAIAAVIGLEKVDLRSSRSVAKIIGTVICLGGAMLMAFFKGPRLLGAVLLSAADDWVRGGIYLMGNAFCFSVWYILQVPVCKSYLDPLSLATWMCFLATLQCAVMAFFLEANYIEIWKLASIWELPCILYGGVFASGANFFLQSWCISVKGPLYSAIFTPLSAVITTVLSTLFLHEELHIGSMTDCIVSTTRLLRLCTVGGQTRLIVCSLRCTTYMMTLGLRYGPSVVVTTKMTLLYDAVMEYVKQHHPPPRRRRQQHHHCHVHRSLAVGPSTLARPPRASDRRISPCYSHRHHEGRRRSEESLQADGGSLQTATLTRRSNRRWRCPCSCMVFSPACKSGTGGSGRPTKNTQRRSTCAISLRHRHLDSRIHRFTRSN